MAAPRVALARPVRRPHLRVLARPRLRVADVALFYGGASGGIRTYLDAKADWARRAGACEHHLIVPGPAQRHEDLGAGAMRHELPSLRLAGPNGYRLPVGARALRATLRLIRPDVVLLHDPFWRPLDVAGLVQRNGGAVVMVHHGSAALGAGAVPGPHALYARVLRSWLRRAYAPADAVMSACDARPDAGRAAELELRFGLHPAFRPRPGTPRGDHVLYAGRLAREKGVLTLLEAAARSRDPWPLVLVGAGPATRAVHARIQRLGLGGRVSVRPFEPDREALARAFAGARCVVMPGPHETFGLAAFEAAAAGAATVACETAPSAAALGGLAETFAPGDAAGLERAIARARSRDPDPAAAAAHAARHGWSRAFAAELADLERLVR
jgi:alpha-1,6-mannosyltransferase